jgi:protease PrsW
MTPPASPDATSYLVCIAGPDQGKQVILSATPQVMGRAPGCNVHSDDPWVTDQYAALLFAAGVLRVQALSQAWPLIGGQSVGVAEVHDGQQVQMGGSMWQLHAAAGPGFVQRLGDRLTAAAGIEKAGEFSPQEMFGDIARTHADYEIEAFLTVGTTTTTPPLSAIDARWPKPWVFARVFGMTVLLYAGFLAANNAFHNEKLIPALLMIGTIAIPISLLVFFFEVNVPRNISIYQLIKLLGLGGLVSIVVSLIGFQVTGLGDTWLGSSSAGILEETGKTLTLLLVIRNARYRWTLNGLLLGATVGTGFKIIESAGYAFTALLRDGGGQEAMIDNIMLRGLLAIIGGHILWTGLVGAALWRVRGNRPFDPSMLTDFKFLRVLFLCMAMHMLWNAPINPPFYLKQILIGVVAWTLILAFIQDGLKQVREAQALEGQGAK